jgi:hypothetical protein
MPIHLDLRNGRRKGWLVGQQAKSLCDGLRELPRARCEQIVLGARLSHGGDMRQAEDDFAAVTPDLAEPLHNAARANRIGIGPPMAAA